MTYQFFYDSNGALSCVNRLDSGATVYIPNRADYAEDNPLTAEFLATNPDLSDRPDLAWQPASAPPNWAGLLIQFQLPGNPLYLAIISKVAQSGFLAQDHWQNLKALLLSPNLQDTNALSAGMQHLSSLLSQAGHPLSAEDIAQWNALLNHFRFPEECRL